MSLTLHGDTKTRSLTLLLYFNIVFSLRMAVIGWPHYCTAELQLTITFIIDPFISIIMCLIYHGLCYLGHWRDDCWCLVSNSMRTPALLLARSCLRRYFVQPHLFYFNSFDTDMDSLVDVFFFCGAIQRCFFSHFSKPLNFEAKGASHALFLNYSLQISACWGRRRGRNVRMRQAC